MNKSLRLMRACILVLVILALGAGSCSAPLQKFERTRDMMDTFVTIIVYTADEAKADTVMNAAFDRMEEIEDIASIYDEQSQAFQLNHDGYLDAPSPDLKRLIELSTEYSELTDGYFDITVQPLLDLWSAGLWAEPEDIQQNRVNETLQIVGWDKIEMENDRILLTKEGMEITLGGIAKGYAVDEALKVIRGMGVKNALINAGGDMASIGAKPDGEPWYIALVNPDDTTQSLANFDIVNNAITTSGNYERYFSPDKSASHILNPKTGYSSQGVISVTVIADTATQADALSTSIFVMGPDAGIELVESLSNVECMIVSEDRQTIYASSGLSEYLVSSEQGE